MGTKDDEYDYLFKGKSVLDFNKIRIHRGHIIYFLSINMTAHLNIFLFYMLLV